MLYIFAGFPGKDAPAGSLQLHAGSLQYCVETVEELELLEHDPVIQYRKEGMFATGTDEMLYPVEYRMSDLCLKIGITWDWFPKNSSFGNGLTIHKTLASPDYKTVVHGTDLSLDQFLTIMSGPKKLAEIELVWHHDRHEIWKEYEARWLPGTCPQWNHEVYLTCLVIDYKLPGFAYERIMALIGDGAEPKDRHLYSTEHGKHFSTIRRHLL